MIFRALVFLLLLCVPATAQNYDERAFRADELRMDALYVAGDYEGAAALLREMLPKAVALFGEASREALSTETALANALSNLGRRAEAVAHSRHVYDTALAQLGEYNIQTIRAAMALGVQLSQAGAPEEALPLVARAVQVAEQMLGPDDPTTITWRFNLAGVFFDLWYLDEALAEFRKARVALAAKDDLRSQRTAAVAARQIARTLRNMDRRDEAVAAYAEALADYRRVYGPTHPDTADTMAEYGLAMWRAGQREALGPVVDELEAVTRTAYGDDSLPMAEVLELSALYLSQGGPGTPGFDEGLGLQARSVALKEKLLTPTNTALGAAYLDLSAMLEDKGDKRAAYDLARKAEAAGSAGREWLYYTLSQAQAAGVIPDRAAVAEALRIAQTTQASLAASANWKLGIRLALGDSETGRNYRRATDLVERQSRLQQQLVTLTGLPAGERDSRAEEALRAEIGANEAEITRLQALVAAEQPKLETLVGGTELTLDELQALLAPDEALVILDVSPVEGESHFAIAISKDRAEWAELNWTAESFTMAVADIRESIGERLGTRAGAALKTRPQDPQDDMFHYNAASWLYDETVGQVAGVIDGKTHLYFDLRGPVAALPPSLMLKSPATDPDPGRAHFLIRDHAVTVIPSIQSLRTGALAASRPRAGRPFLGYADPIYDVPEEVLVASAAPAGLRGSLAPLPETADEVREVAATFGAGVDARLGEAASEAALKAAAVGDYRILYFATHGLVAGDAVGATQLGEPALALTPGQGEDGFLTASEILALQLNADWVVLSACNTAVGNQPGEQALSGLAQAFIYAGSRSLLVSHWPVESKSAVALMTDLFARRAADPRLTAAEAQRQAILAMLDAPGRPEWSHPAYWAPFILVGDPG